MGKLAQDGGTPVRTAPLPGGFHSSAEFGDLERDFIFRVLEKKRVFRFLSGMEESESVRFENAYKERTGAKRALAVNSGTSALICALVGAGVGPGDEVIIPGYTYIATAAAVVAVKAVPIIVEVDDTLTIDPAAFERAITPYTKAVIPVHMRGIPCQMDEIMEIANRRGIAVIEDVAQANGGSYKGKALGTIGLAGIYSFQQYKVITSGEGGLLLSDDETLMARASLTHDSAANFWNTGDITVPTFVGENYRMSEIQAALGLAQLTKLDSIIGRLRAVKARVRELTAGMKVLKMQRLPDPEGDIATCIIVFAPDNDAARWTSKALNAEGLYTGTIYDNVGICDRHVFINWDYIIDKRASTPAGCPWSCGFYKGNATYSKDMCPNTMDFLGRAVSMGLHQTMTMADAEDIAEALLKVDAHLVTYATK